MEQTKKAKAKIKQNVTKNYKQENESEMSNRSRLPVLKTYKLYIDGKFPRSESGRFYKLQSDKNDLVANICRASKKDFRNAVVSARNAQTGWSLRSAYNKSQILYRIAETLEGRRSQFCDSLTTYKEVSKQKATNEFNIAVDRLVYFAGWCDKYQQVFSSVNPVESSHFNFSFPEPTGVVSAIAPENFGLLGLVSIIAPVIAGGNSIIVLASENYPHTAIEFAEVLNASDLPNGVVNILTGFVDELHDPFSQHMDVNATAYCGSNKLVLENIRMNAAENVKRIVHFHSDNWFDENINSPYKIMDFQEIKTTWHPIGN